ncbi:MAG: hypothetical protein H6561_19405 [Lewinellaceae bacterium]|nr:hypothetical protein [Lewinellaceae bacterium]
MKPSFCIHSVLSPPGYNPREFSSTDSVRQSGNSRTAPCIGIIADRRAHKQPQGVFRAGQRVVVQFEGGRCLVGHDRERSHRSTTIRCFHYQGIIPGSSSTDSVRWSEITGTAPCIGIITDRRTYEQPQGVFRAGQRVIVQLKAGGVWSDTIVMKPSYCIRWELSPPGYNPRSLRPRIQFAGGNYRDRSMHRYNR